MAPACFPRILVGGGGDRSCSRIAILNASRQHRNDHGRSPSGRAVSSLHAPAPDQQSGGRSILPRARLIPTTSAIDGYPSFRENSGPFPWHSRQEPVGFTQGALVLDGGHRIRLGQGAANQVHLVHAELPEVAAHQRRVDGARGLALQHPAQRLRPMGVDQRVGALVGAEDRTEELATHPQPSVETSYSGRSHLQSCFNVSEMAVASLSAATSELAALTGGAQVALDRSLTDQWFDMTVRPIGWTIPETWDPIAGDYRARNGWIRLHTNVPRHREASLSVPRVDADRERGAEAAARWDRFDLENAVIADGGCAAAMLSLDEWAAHPQGRSVATEPLIAWDQISIASPLPLPVDRLAALRVLDLARVLARPVATRFLAGFGAQVLRVDPPGREEKGLEPEVTLGKSCAGLDLHTPADRTRFEELLRTASVLVHGYRPGALEVLGHGVDARRALNPALVDVTLSAYGGSGPWAGRRGFDSLVQMSSGLAAEGMRRGNAGKPVPLPVQALNHATGYLIATAVLHALRLRQASGRVMQARLSLARTAALLVSGGFASPQHARSAPGPDELLDEILEDTHRGPAYRVAFPVKIDGRGPVWRHAAGPFRSGPALWPG